MKNTKFLNLGKSASDLGTDASDRKFRSKNGCRIRVQQPWKPLSSNLMEKNFLGGATIVHVCQDIVMLKLIISNNKLDTLKKSMAKTIMPLIVKPS